MDQRFVNGLQDAVDTYNDWAVTHGASYNVKAAYNELRGIFYNKLASCLAIALDLKRGSRMGYWHGNQFTMITILPTEKIQCHFTEDGYLTHVSFVSSEGTIQERREFIDQLIAASKQVVCDKDPHMRAIKQAYRKIISL